MQPTPTFLFTDHPAQTDDVSRVRSQCLNYGWILTIKKTGTDGDGKILIEQSHDQSTWFPYIDPEICTDLILDSWITLTGDDDFLITDEMFHGYFFRITYQANGTTTGTISATLHEKIRS